MAGNNDHIYGPKTDAAIDTMRSSDAYADFAAVGMAFLDQAGVSAEAQKVIATIVINDVLAHSRKMGEKTRRDRVTRKITLEGQV